ncbi:GNAT family N-acetyltransferase [Dehalococcoidia bacterium]|nr:GNAT family N-acetyltransferase [Dehalococcoidia bacterium]
MNYSLTRETFVSLAPAWSELCLRTTADSLFVTPRWLDIWWQQFGKGREWYLCAVRDGDAVIGVAPLLLKGNRASFMGSPDVCDYLDFVVAPEREADFFNTLLTSLAESGIVSLDLLSLRPDSTVLTSLAGIARERGLAISCEPHDVSLELDLPATWDEYLEMLSAKQRHEVRRKLRRLREAGEIDYDVEEDPRESMEFFLRLFRANREDKAAFMTAQMESFFRSIAEAMADVLRLEVLKIDTLPVAVVMCFDYRDVVYLYNSAYNPRYASLSVGVLSKVFCIQNSIQRGRKRFDFLKGAEVYKYRLGGKEIPLYDCRIALC